MIKVLLKNELLVLKNSFLRRSTNQMLSALVPFGLLLVALGFFVHIIAGSIGLVVSELGLELTRPVITTLFYVIMLWVLISIFLSILKEARLKFYASPELSLLISSPIPVNTLFIFRFVLVTFFSVGILSFVMVLPTLIAIGIVSAAPWFYYLFILPLGSLLVLISASLAILVVMLLAKVLSPKKIMLATVAFGLIGMLLWIALITMGEEILPRLLEWVMAGQLIWYLIFPLSDAARVLSGLVQGEIALLPLGRLLVACGVILSASTLAAGKLFYEGYERTQVVEIAAEKRGQRQAKGPLFLGRRGCLILTEWKKAVRNYGVAQEALSPLLILFLFLFMVGRAAPLEPWDSLLLLVHIGMIGFLVSQAVAKFFIPAASLQGRKALKEQYSVLKAAPFGGRVLILSHWLAPFIPQILLSGTILLVLNIVIGTDIPIILLSLLVLPLLVGSGSAFLLMIDMAAYSRQEETTSLLHRLLRTILPILYYKLALGILAVGLVFTGMMIAVSIVAFLVVVGLTSYCSFRLGAKYWERMEI